MSPAQQAAAAAGVPTTGELARAQMKTTARERVANKDVPLWRQWLDALDPVAYWLLRVAGAGAVLSIAYLLWGIFGGQIGTAPNGTDPQVIQNIALAGSVLKWSLIGLVISTFVLMFDAAPLGIATAVVGAALQFGSPLLLKSIGQTPAMGAFAIQLIAAGKVIFMLGLIKTALDTAAWLSELPNRMQQRADVGVGQMAEVAQQRAARNATMFSPCWQLPFCREVIRKQCPAYLAKTRCWKFGRGCYCDEEMISRIIRGESIDMIKAPTRMSRQGKPPCGRCYIFLEHQTLKYKMFSPVAIPATIIIMYLGWGTYERLFGVLGGSLTAVWAKLSFAKATVTTTVTTTTSTPGMPDMSNYQLSPEQVQIAAMNMFGFLLGFFLLIYLSKAIEWAIYKAKF
jgi:hypothetical protein